jgi:hypothetical protein
MEQAARPRRAHFVLFWGIGWGGLTALLSWLFDWHRTGFIDSVHHIVIRFAVFMAAGTFVGLWMWKKQQSPSQKRIGRNESVVRTVIFWVVMVLLAILLWRIR